MGIQNLLKIDVEFCKVINMRRHKPQRSKQTNERNMTLFFIVSTAECVWWMSLGPRVCKPRPISKYVSADFLVIASSKLCECSAQRKVQTGILKKFQGQVQCFNAPSTVHSHRLHRSYWEMRTPDFLSIWQFKWFHFIIFIDKSETNLSTYQNYLAKYVQCCAYSMTFCAWFKWNTVTILWWHLNWIYIFFSLELPMLAVISIEFVVHKFVGQKFHLPSNIAAFEPEK